MIQTIQSNVLNYVNNTNYGKSYKTGSAAETEGTAEKKTKQPAASGNTITSMDGDTITISAAGKEYAKTAATGTSTSAADDTTSAVVNDSVISSVSAAQTENEASVLDTIQTEETDTDETSATASTNDLSSYSESELREMRNNGEITQAEYNKEIRNRESEAAAMEAAAAATEE